MEFDMDIATPICVAWSCGSAQVTYPMVGPTTLIIGCANTIKYIHKGKKHKIKEAWIPFAVSTTCIIPVVGGIIAGKIWNN